MSTGRWQRVQELFEAALACSPEERDTLLAERCGDDAELRAEVESLLAHDEQAPPEFMHPPQIDREDPDPTGGDGPDPRIGKKIGRYSIQEVIAAGGMGTVYLAQQEHPRREVALKVMRAGVSSRSGIRRFEYESQVLAHLKHPHIAQVYEAGVHEEATPAGKVRVPYFVMEFIEGARSITAYADENGLRTRERLELFARVCDAVHHGHQKGIIHRDLKPPNLLVDASGHVKVIDFGVARSTDADMAVTTVRTDAGELVGTLQYMSPEQCDANPHELDTRSDVYSLGVVLYELLTGKPPYDTSTSTIYQATRTIKEQMPRRLSTINRKLRGDAETIVLKALEKAPDKRYPSAADLAQDIRRFLNREPIEARPPTAWTKAQRWIARHPLLTTAAGCIAVGLVASSLATYVALWLPHTRPHKLAAESDREVRLLSLTGNILRMWSTQLPKAKIVVPQPALVDRPRHLGGGRLALLGFNTAWDMEYPNALVAYDVDRSLTEPAWAKRIEPGDPLPDPHGRGYLPSQFRVTLGAVFNIFPETPEPEVVAVHNVQKFSQSIIRIYDLRGKVQYEVWHDGVLGGCRWMSDAGLLVFCGSNDVRRWDELGYPDFGMARPMVVFAIRPERGSIQHGFLQTTPGNNALSPAWYNCLLPPDIGLILVKPPWKGNPRHSVGVSVEVDEQRNAWCFWDIDKHGDEISDSRGTTDEYKRYKSELPDRNVFKLVPFGPIADRGAPFAPAVTESDDGR